MNIPEHNSLKLMQAIIVQDYFVQFTALGNRVKNITHKQHWTVLLLLLS